MPKTESEWNHERIEKQGDLNVCVYKSVECKPKNTMAIFTFGQSNVVHVTQNIMWL